MQIIVLNLHPEKCLEGMGKYIKKLCQSNQSRDSNRDLSALKSAQPDNVNKTGQYT